MNLHLEIDPYFEAEALITAAKLTFDVARFLVWDGVRAQRFDAVGFRTVA